MTVYKCDKCGSGLEFKITDNSACDDVIIVLPCNSCELELWDKAYNEGYEEGHSVGYDEGLDNLSDTMERMQ